MAKKIVRSLAKAELLKPSLIMTRDSKLERYGLVNVIKELRERKEWGANKIAAYINTTPNILPDGVAVSTSSIAKYIQEIEGKSSKNKTYEVLNIYNEERRLLEIINSAIQTTEGFLENINDEASVGGKIDIKEFSSLSHTLNKLIERHSSLTTKIAETQAKIYSYSAVQTIIEAVFDKVKKKDKELFKEIEAEIKLDPMLAEAFKRIRR